MAPSGEITFFSDGETYNRDIRVARGVPGTPEYKERVEKVELRPLMAGDRADLQDAVRIAMADDEGEETGGTELRMGTMRILTVAKAIVSWSLPQAPTVSTVRALTDEVFNKIYDEVSWGEVPAEPKETPETPLGDSNGSSAKPELAPAGELS